MRRLKKGTITFISILWITLVMLFNLVLICGCINGNYDGIYILIINMFITFINMSTVVVLQDLKNWRF